MKQGVDKKPYFLLAEPVAVDDLLLNSLLGLAVENPEDPIGGRHRPHEPLRPRDGVDNLYPRLSVTCTDFKRVAGNTRGAKAYARLERVVNLSLSKNNSQQVDLEAAQFRRINMADARTKIETLLGAPPPESVNSAQLGNQAAVVSQAANAPSTQATPSGGLWSRFNLFKQASPAPSPDLDEEASHKAKQEETRAKYQSEVLGLLGEQKDHKLGIIVSFITCSDMTKNKDSSKKTSGGAEVSTGPASEFIDAAFGGEYSSQHDVGVQGAYQGEYLIACSYLPLFKGKKEGFLNKLLHWGVGDEEMWEVGSTKMKGHMDAPLSGKNKDTEEPVKAMNPEEEEAYGFLMMCVDSEDESESDDEDGEQN
ncbi:hypothetical protein FALBO_7108 [Fusarium albosuccineum]|uniref:Uncharacterized protein n=1 Tax=Fusarium albosuccineum TaxID=1237068 RepID=A0A8H4PE15_9HYPO|nr:hypothetical protein FALBO_7108 [Fusarium albosuccineum]